MSLVHCSEDILSSSALRFASEPLLFYVVLDIDWMPHVTGSHELPNHLIVASTALMYVNFIVYSWWVHMRIALQIQQRGRVLLL